MGVSGRRDQSSFWLSLASAMPNSVRRSACSPISGRPSTRDGDHGVEHAREREPEVALERGHVVVGAMQDLHHRGVGEERGQRRQVACGQGVDEPAALLHADLHQADLLAMVVQAVRFRVEGDGAAARERPDQLRQLTRGADPSGHGRSIGEQERLRA